MVAANFNIGGNGGPASAAKHDRLSRSLQEIIFNFVRAPGRTSGSPADGQRIRATASSCNAMEIAEIGIDDGDIGHSAEVNPTLRFVLRGAMHPKPVKDQVVRLFVLIISQLNQVPCMEFWHSTCDF